MSSTSESIRDHPASFESEAKLSIKKQTILNISNVEDLPLDKSGRLMVENTI